MPDLYPVTLPDFSNVKRSVNKRFSAEMPILESEINSMDYTAVFSVDIICKTYEQSQAFENWIINLDNAPFLKDLRTEYGVYQYECAFLELPLEPIENNNSYTYSAVIFTDRLKTDLDNIDRQLVDRYKLDRKTIDTAINQFWPKSGC